MRRLRSLPGGGARALLGSLVLGLCVLGLVACGGGDGETKAAVGSAEDAEIGKAIRSGDWEVELTGPAEKQQMIGGDVGGGTAITYQAQNGVYVIVPVRVTNHMKEMDVVPRDLLVLVDDQGNQAPACHSTIQVAYVHMFEIDLLLDSPLPAGATRDSVCLFDVSADASGLKLGVKDTTETAAVGF